MYPKITISYCAKCKWHNRAVWYLQEVLQTFGEPERNVAEISLCPSYDSPGLFKIEATKSENESKILYQRKMRKTVEVQTEEFFYDGFPDSKFVKVLIRNYLFPEERLGHVDGHSMQLNDGQGKKITEKSDTGGAIGEELETSVKLEECVSCKENE